MQHIGIATSPERASHIALNGQDFTPLIRAIAWRTLKRAKGQSAQMGRVMVLSLAQDGGRSA